MDIKTKMKVAEQIVKAMAYTIPGTFTAASDESGLVRIEGKTKEGLYLLAYISIEGVIRNAAETIIDRGIWKKKP